MVKTNLKPAKCRLICIYFTFSWPSFLTFKYQLGITILKIIIRSFSGQIILAAVLALILVNLLPASMLTPTNPLTHFIELGKLLYIGLLKMFVGIVVLFALLQGITNLGSVVRLKTLGLKTLAIYSLTSSIAIAIGLSASLFMPKWQAINTVPKTETFELISNHASGSEIISHLLNMILVNPFSALGSVDIDLSRFVRYFIRSCITYHPS